MEMMGRKTKASHICPFKKTIIMKNLYGNVLSISSDGSKIK